MIQKRQFYSLNFMKMTVLSSELSTDNTYDAAILCATLTFWPSLLSFDYIHTYLEMKKQSRVSFKSTENVKEIQGVLAHHGFVYHGFRPSRFFGRFQFLAYHGILLVHHGFFPSKN